MPKILTKVYKNALFFLPYSRDKSEGVWCKPLTMTKRNELRRQAQIEAGMDTDIADAYLTRAMLEESIVDWKGFWTASGEEIPYSKEVLRDMCECDPGTAVTMLARILEIARMGELEDKKN